MIDWQIDEENRRRRGSGYMETSELAWKAAARQVVGLARKHEAPRKVGYVLAWIYPGESAFHDECARSEILDGLVADLSKSGRF